MKAKEAIKVIISGGGTGGHVFPAIAIAEAIKAKEPDADILFVGAKGKIEMEKVPKAGFPIRGLWISGFHRKLTVRNLLFPIKLVSSLVKAIGIVNSFKPQVAVGVGGFASGPVLKIANMMGVKTVLQEQNSYAGVTNKLLAQKADKICVAYEGMERYFPKDKIVLTGNPVRTALANSGVSKEEALRYFGLETGKKTICVFGGSLGAKSINVALEEQANIIGQHPEVQVLWQVGKLYEEQYRKGRAAQLPNVKMTAFVDRMDMAYQMADLIVCRAGALTISELCLMGKPAMLIPSPNVAEDHQTKNAMALAEKNAAVLLPDAESKERLFPLALEVLNDEEKLKELAENSLKMAHPNAASDIADVIIELGSDKVITSKSKPC